MIFEKKHKRIKDKRTNEQSSMLVKAFSLVEILVVLAIMGILIMLVVPNQAGVASRTKSLEAQQELKMIHNLQYAYFLQFSKYTSDLQTLSYIPHKSVLNGGTANYEISIEESFYFKYKKHVNTYINFISIHHSKRKTNIINIINQLN